SLCAQRLDERELHGAVRVLVRDGESVYNRGMNLNNGYTVTIHQSGEQYTARIGDCSAQGNTPEAAFLTLGQRIAGLPEAQRQAIWATGAPIAGEKTKASVTGE